MRKLVYLLVFTFVFSGCQEWLTIQPETMLAKDEMFSTREGFRDALAGIYARMSDQYNHRGNMMSGTIEHLACQWSVRVDSKEEALNNHDYKDSRTESDLEKIFHDVYKAIANANLFLEYVEDTDVLKQEERDMYKGEVLILRAFMHFDLLRLWGPMPGNERLEHKYLPYVRKMSIELNAYQTYSEYVDLLLADLLEGERLLKMGDVGKTTRITYAGVLAFKARVYLWLGRDQESVKIAKTLCDSLEKHAGLKLATYGDKGAFTSEHIFSLRCDFEEKVFGINLFNEVDYLDKLYEYSASDIRYDWWDLIDKGDNSTDKSLNKYDAGDLVPIFRLAELYMIVMEKGSLEEANAAYEKYCRARMMNYTEIVSEQGRQEILLKEWRKEFIAEGQLFFFYKRWGVKSMPRCKKICGTADYVLPIPERETNVNK